MKTTTNERLEFYGDFYEKSYTAMGIFNRQDAEKQVAQILTLLSAESGSHILDWCGAWGRHAIPMAKAGHRVTLLDYSEPYIRRAERDAEAQGVKLATIVSDFRETPAEIQADYAVNLFTAGIGHISKSDDLTAFKSLYAALRPGATFLIDTIGLPHVMRRFSESNWRESEDGTKRFLEKRVFDFTSSTAMTTWVYQDMKAGTEESHSLPLHIYSPWELVELLASVGFGSCKLYSDFTGDEFTIESKRIVLVCEKP
jgi:cyclopropane fatty-acyl-phospholipid synthase-like methyltransferase